jgi:hypothetical protein
MESGLGPLQWLHGLEEYFEFIQDKESRQLVQFLIKLLYANNPVIKTTDDASMEEFMYTFSKFSSAPVVEKFRRYYYAGHSLLSIQDAFSRGQVQSKIWLAQELAKLNLEFDMVYVLAGWFGQVVDYLEYAGVKYDRARIIDVDPTACEISDKIFNASRLDNYKVKAIEWDITDDSWLSRSGCSYPVKNYHHADTIHIEKTIPDLIINTSAEHVSEQWYSKFMNRPLESDPLFVIQSNNLFDVEEHVNCVHSIDHMKKKFPMTRILYSGGIQLKGYKRFMLIGRP